MGKIITNFINTNYYIVFFFLLLIIVLLLLLGRRVYHYFHGNFGEGNIFRRLKKLYEKYDYPYIKHGSLTLVNGIK